MTCDEKQRNELIFYRHNSCIQMTRDLLINKITSTDPYRPSQTLAHQPTQLDWVLWVWCWQAVKSSGEFFFLSVSNATFTTQSAMWVQPPKLMLSCAYRLLRFSTHRVKLSLPPLYHTPAPITAWCLLPWGFWATCHQCLPARTLIK